MVYKLLQVKVQVLALQFCFSATSHFRLQGSATCSIISKACAEARQTYPHMPAESTPDGETMSGWFDVFDCLIQFYSKRRYGSYILHILLHPNWFWKGIQIVIYYILLHPTTSYYIHVSHNSFVSYAQSWWLSELHGGCRRAPRALQWQQPPSCKRR